MPIGTVAVWFVVPTYGFLMYISLLHVIKVIIYIMILNPSFPVDILI